MKSPKVSVLCITYNHKAYIEQALEGFVSQKTNFSFEILINDDASTDGTREIIKKYQEKYPGIIKPNFQKKNLYSQGIRGMFVRFLLPKARGKYIALCEGDDYWTDPNKLQKQVDFMDQHPDYALCFHPVKVIFENKEKPDGIYPIENKISTFTVEELLKGNFIQTNSVMYRKQSYKNMATNVMPGDWYLHLYHAQFGRIGFINKPMAVYRRHAGSIWWNSHTNISKIWEKHGIEHLNLYKTLLDMYGKNKAYQTIILDAFYKMAGNLIETDQKYKTKLLRTTMKQFPDEIELYIAHQHQKAIKDEQTIRRLKEVYLQKENSLQQKISEIRLLKASRFWKLRNMFARLVGKKVI